MSDAAPRYADRTLRGGAWPERPGPQGQERRS